MLEVLYEDEYVFVINKLVGLVVYFGVGNFIGMLVNVLLFCDLLLVVLLCVGIVYWLDKDISGVMVIVCMLEV